MLLLIMLNKAKEELILVQRAGNDALQPTAAAGTTCVLFPHPGTPLAVLTPSLPRTMLSTFTHGLRNPTKEPRIEVWSLPHFKEEETEAQREVTGLALNLPARKWLRARLV